VFHISSTLYCIFILCIIVTNLALWLQDLNKLTYLLTYLLAFSFLNLGSVTYNVTFLLMPSELKMVEFYC